VRINDRLNFFAQGALGIEINSFFPKNDPDGKPFLSHLTLGGQVGVGVTYFLRNGWALEGKTQLGTAEFGLLRSPGIEPTTFLNATGGINNLTQLSVGVAHYFGGATAARSTLPEGQRSPYEAGQRYFSGGFDTGLFIDTPPISSGNNKGNNHNITVALGRFTEAGNARGVSFSAGYSYRETSNGRSSDAMLGVRPYQEFYWPLGTEKWLLFLNAGVGGTYRGSFQKATLAGSTSDSHSVTVFASAFPGIQYQFSPKWALVATVGDAGIGNVTFDRAIREQSTVTSDSYGLSLNINPFVTLNAFGLSLRYFPHRKEAKPTTPNSF